ncbi:hypothetical protein Zmor_009049 [Zophobas morio]|uniref:Uncharacterized protein n=1 Tax=Zophobas morio TaxID=2755281 RepID=A0AA38HJZ1_9CUCU|nr:hypothetical protein Zmor_009049 [Zophobas morio]
MRSYIRGTSKSITEIKALENFINEMHPQQKTNISIFTDNELVCNIIKGDALNKRLGRVDIVHHYVKEELKISNHKVLFTPSSNSIADRMTKSYLIKNDNTPIVNY